MKSTMDTYVCYTYQQHTFGSSKSLVGERKVPF
jgi:hypothetical protein